MGHSKKGSTQTLEIMRKAMVATLILQIMVLASVNAEKCESIPNTRRIACRLSTKLTSWAEGIENSDDFDSSLVSNQDMTKEKCIKLCQNDPECQFFREAKDGFTIDITCTSPTTSFTTTTITITTTQGHGCGADTECEAGQSCVMRQCRNPVQGDLIRIDVKTKSCDGCTQDTEEDGLIVTLNDDTGKTCISSVLDKENIVDYNPGKTAPFLAVHGDGMDNCRYADLSTHVSSGSVEWTGAGTWIGSSHNTLCFYFFDDSSTYYKIFNCCDLDNNVLTKGVGSSLTNCRECNLGFGCPWV